jgi:hypothetical protein
VSHGTNGHHHHHHGVQSASAERVANLWRGCDPFTKHLIDVESCSGPTKLPVD